MNVSLPVRPRWKVSISSPVWTKKPNCMASVQTIHLSLAAQHQQQVKESTCSHLKPAVVLSSEPSLITLLICLFLSERSASKWVRGRLTRWASGWLTHSMREMVSKWDKQPDPISQPCAVHLYLSSPLISAALFPLPSHLCSLLLYLCPRWSGSP